MTIVDNFLPSKVFLALSKYCEEIQFKPIYVEGKLFLILEPPELVLPYLEEEGHSIILAFIRCDCTEDLGALNIHADGIINGNETSLACKIYINRPTGSNNGISFYSHHKYGSKLPSISYKEYAKLLKENSFNKQKWKKIDSVADKPNRKVIYDAKLFTSREPCHIPLSRRIVLEVYYKIKTP